MSIQFGHQLAARMAAAAVIAAALTAPAAAADKPDIDPRASEVEHDSDAFGPDPSYDEPEEPIDFWDTIEPEDHLDPSEEPWHDEGDAWFGEEEVTR